MIQKARWNVIHRAWNILFRYYSYWKQIYRSFMFIFIVIFKKYSQALLKYVHFSKNIALHIYDFLCTTLQATYWVPLIYIDKISLDRVLWTLDFSKLFWDSSCEILDIEDLLDSHSVIHYNLNPKVFLYFWQHSKILKNSDNHLICKLLYMTGINVEFRLSIMYLKSFIIKRYFLNGASFLMLVFL